MVIDAIIKFEKGKGYTNPYSHHRRCIITFGPGSTLLRNLTQKERFVVHKHRPVSYVEDGEVRKFSEIEERFSSKTFKEVLFKVVEFVELAIGKEMKEMKGAILYDGWTSNAMHYFGLFAVYCRKIDVIENGQANGMSVVCCPLLSVSPQANSDPDFNDEEATKFAADAHIHHIRDIFPFYKGSLAGWALCQISDNCPTNKSIAAKPGIPHVGCLSNKLHLEMKAMIRNDVMLRSLLDDIGSTMKASEGESEKQGHAA